MRTCLYYICSSPEVYKKLQKEIDDYYEAKGLSEPISYLQTQELPYLKAVVKEATRLLPSIVYQLLRYAPPGGLHVRGHSIPEGTPVGISPISQNRDPQIWGGDANEFIPERWLGDPAHARRLEASLMTFGGE
jgi:cytochrome P450